MTVFQHAQKNIVNQVLADRETAGQSNKVIEKRTAIALVQNAEFLDLSVADSQHQQFVTA